MFLATRTSARLTLAIGLGLALTAAAQAQLININLTEKATFSGFVGGVSNFVTNNGSTNLIEVVTTGNPTSTPFSITYDPLEGISSVNLNTGTLNTATFVLKSTVTPVNYFSSVGFAVQYDFDTNGVFDLTQNYTFNLSSFTASNGLTGVNYSIVPQNSVGTVFVNGQNYGYASVVSNNAGVLFDGSSTTAALQFQFLQTPTSSVPEPSTYALFGVLALGTFVVIRQRQRNIALGLKA